MAPPGRRDTGQAGGPEGHDGADTVLVDVRHCTLVSAGAPAPVAVTGQTKCWDPTDTDPPIAEIDCSGHAATGQDGHKKAGVPFRNSRFTDNGDGTVTDHLTGLIWLKNANGVSPHLAFHHLRRHTRCRGGK